MTIYFIILLIMTLLGAIASLFFKKASKTDGIIDMVKNVNLYIGGGLYLTSAIMNIYILRYLEYSIVLPLTSFTYVWTMVLSYCFLKEKMTTKKISGVVLVIMGALIVSM